MEDDATKIDANRLIIPGLAGLYNLGAPVAYAFTRVVMGLMFLPSGIDKMFLGGHARVAEGNIAALGLEPRYAWAWTVAGVEFFGALLIIVGLFTRPVAFAIAVQLAVITFGIQIKAGYFWNVRGFDVGLLMMLVFLAFCFGGGGRWSADRAIGREF